MVGRPAAAGGGGLILGDRQAQGACWDLKYVEFCRKVGNSVHGVKDTTKAIDYHDSNS
jgi:hypothetical protein